MLLNFTSIKIRDLRFLGIQSSIILRENLTNFFRGIGQLIPLSVKPLLPSQFDVQNILKIKFIASLRQEFCFSLFLQSPSTPQFVVAPTNVVTMKFSSPTVKAFAGTAPYPREEVVDTDNSLSLLPQAAPNISSNPGSDSSLAVSVNGAVNSGDVVKSDGDSELPSPGKRNFTHKRKFTTDNTLWQWSIQS